MAATVNARYRNCITFFWQAKTCTVTPYYLQRALARLEIQQCQLTWQAPPKHATDAQQQQQQQQQQTLRVSTASVRVMWTASTRLLAL